jgi:hypothetical protein
MLEQQLRVFPHILVGTQQFVRELLQRPVPAGCWMFRVDVAHVL